jgi:hypothetical protein
MDVIDGSGTKVDIAADASLRGMSKGDVFKLMRPNSVV